VINRLLQTHFLPVNCFLVNRLLQTHFLPVNCFLGNRLLSRLNYESLLPFDPCVYPGDTFNKFLAPAIGRTKKRDRWAKRLTKNFTKPYPIPVGKNSLSHPWEQKLTQSVTTTFTVCLCTFIVPAGTLRLPSLRFFRAFSSVVKANARVKPAKARHGLHSSKILCRSVYCVCVCVCVCVCTVLLPPGGYPIAVNKYIILFHFISCIISYHISHHIIYIIFHFITLHIIPYHFTYHIISYHISFHIISFHIISFHIISFHIILYHIIYIISYNIISYHIISYHIVLYHIIYHITYRIISYILSYHFISYHIIREKLHLHTFRVQTCKFVNAK
jgi:hypothetical protein